MENRGRGAQILLIEDNDTDASLIKEAFNQRRGINDFFIAGDGETAIDYLEKIGADDEHKRPDMIFLDLDLPKEDGFTVLEEIKSNPLLRSIPVVILTTSNGEDHVTKSYHLNANCFVTKPAETEKFIEVVKLIESFWFGIAMLPGKLESAYH